MRIALLCSLLSLTLATGLSAAVGKPAFVECEGAMAAAFTEDESELVIALRDGVVCVADAETGSVRMRFNTEHKYGTPDVELNGRAISYHDGKRRIGFWNYVEPKDGEIRNWHLPGKSYRTNFDSKVTLGAWGAYLQVEGDKKSRARPPSIDYLTPWLGENCVLATDGARYFYALNPQGEGKAVISCVDLKEKALVFHRIRKSNYRGSKTSERIHYDNGKLYVFGGMPGVEVYSATSGEFVDYLSFGNAKIISLHSLPSLKSLVAVAQRGATIFKADEPWKRVGLSAGMYIDALVASVKGNAIAIRSREGIRVFKLALRDADFVSLPYTSQRASGEPSDLESLKAQLMELLPETDHEGLKRSLNQIEIISKSGQTHNVRHGGSVGVNFEIEEAHPHVREVFAHYMYRFFLSLEGDAEKRNLSDLIAGWTHYRFYSYSVSRFVYAHWEQFRDTVLYLLFEELSKGFQNNHNGCASSMVPWLKIRIRAAKVEERRFHGDEFADSLLAQFSREELSSLALTSDMIESMLIARTSSKLKQTALLILSLRPDLAQTFQEELLEIVEDAEDEEETDPKKRRRSRQEEEEKQLADSVFSLAAHALAMSGDDGVESALPWAKETMSNSAAGSMKSLAALQFVIMAGDKAAEVLPAILESYNEEALTKVNTSARCYYATAVSRLGGDDSAIKPLVKAMEISIAAEKDRHRFESDESSDHAYLPLYIAACFDRDSALIAKETLDLVKKLHTRLEEPDSRLVPGVGDGDLFRALGSVESSVSAKKVLDSHAFHPYFKNFLWRTDPHSAKNIQACVKWIESCVEEDRDYHFFEMGLHPGIQFLARADKLSKSDIKRLKVIKGLAEQRSYGRTLASDIALLIAIHAEKEELDGNAFNYSSEIHFDFLRARAPDHMPKEPSFERNSRRSTYGMFGLGFSNPYRNQVCQIEYYPQLHITHAFHGVSTEGIEDFFLATQDLDETFDDQRGEMVNAFKVRLRSCSMQASGNARRYPNSFNSELMSTYRAAMELKRQGLLEEGLIDELRPSLFVNTIMTTLGMASGEFIGLYAALKFSN